MWTAAILLLFAAGSTRSFQHPLLTTQDIKKSSWWPKESSYTANNMADWLNGASANRTWHGAITPAQTIGRTKGASRITFEHPEPTKQDKEQSSWWPKETSTVTPYPVEWLNTDPPISRLTAAGGWKPYGSLPEITTQGPYSGKTTGGSPRGFEQPLQAKQAKEQSSWWPKGTSTTAPYPGELLNPASSKPSLIAASDVKPYGSSPETTAKGPYSGQTSGGSPRDFEQPLPTKQYKEQSSWWPKGTSTTVPYPGELLNPASSKPSLIAASDVKPYGSSPETTAKGSYSGQTSGGSLRGFEQPLPTKQSKEQSSWWPKGTSTTRFPEDWLPDVSLNPKLTAAGVLMPYGNSPDTTAQGPSPPYDKGLGYSPVHPTAQSWPTTTSKDIKPTYSSEIKIKPSKLDGETSTPNTFEVPQGMPMLMPTKTSSRLHIGSGSSPILSTSQPLPTSTSNIIDPPEIMTKTSHSDNSTPTSISSTEYHPQIRGQGGSPVVATSRRLPTDTSNITELPEIMSNTSELDSDAPTSISSTESQDNPNSIESSTQPRIRDQGGSPVVATSQRLPTDTSNITELPEIMSNTSELDSDAPTSIPSTESQDNPNSIESSTQHRIRDQGGSPVVATSQQLPTDTSNITELPEIMSNTSELDSDAPTPIPSTESHDKPNTIESSTLPQIRGSGRSPVVATSQRLPPTDASNITELPEIMSNTSELGSDALIPIPSTKSHDNPNTIESSTLPQIRGSGRSPVVATSQRLPTDTSNITELPEIMNNSSESDSHAPASIPSTGPHDNPILIESSTPPQMRGSGRSPVLSSSQTLPIGTSQGFAPPYPTEKETKTSKHDINASIPLTTSHHIPKPIEGTPQTRGSGRSPVTATTQSLPTSTSSLNIPPGGPYYHPMTKETSMFIPLAPLGSTFSVPTDGAFAFPTEHVVVENNDDYNGNYFNSPTDQQSVINKDIDGLRNGEPEQVTIEEQELDSNVKININENEELDHFKIEEKQDNDYNSDFDSKDYHHTGGNHHYHHRHYHHHHHAVSRGHGKKHYHHTAAEGHNVEKKHIVETPTVSINNDNPSDMLTEGIDSLNLYRGMPEVAYFLYNPTNFLY